MPLLGNHGALGVEVAGWAEVRSVVEDTVTEGSHLGCHGSRIGGEIGRVCEAIVVVLNLDKLSVDVGHAHEARGSEAMLCKTRWHGVGTRGRLGHGLGLLAQVLEDARVAVGTASPHRLDRL